MEFIELMRTIRRHIVLILVLTVFSAIFSAVVVRRMTKIYSATASMIVPSSGIGSGPSLLGLTSFLTGGMSSGLVEKLAMSDTVAKKVIDSLKLSENKDFASGETTLVQQLQIFHGSTKVDSDPVVMKITFSSPNPKLAAEVANEIVRQISQYLEGETRKDYKYYATEAEAAEGRYDEINEEIRRYEEKSGLVQLENQLSAELGMLNTYQSQLLARNSEIKSLNTILENTTDINLWTGTRQRIEALKSETGILSRKVAEIDAKINLLPGVKREYADLLREKQNRMLHLSELEKQRDISYFQIERSEQKSQLLDRAYVPDSPSSPKPEQIIPVATATGFFLAFFIAVTLDSFKRKEEEPA